MHFPSKPRVAIVCRGCGLDGSVARVALRHAQELAARFEVLLLSDSFPPERIAGVEYVPVRAQRFAAIRRFAHLPEELSFVRAAAHALEVAAPVDFIIAHSHSFAAHIARRLPAVPRALITHGDIFERSEGTFDPIVTRYYRYIEPIACRRATVVLPLSPSLAEAAVRNGARRENVLVLPNGIDLEQYEPHAPRTTNGPLRILFLGRLAHEKGVDVLLDACAVLHRDGVPFRLDLVGGGPLAERLQSRAAEADLGDVVSFRGAFSHAETKAFFADADVVCVPSRSEGQPLVVLEALAAGLPVIGSTASGIPSMIRDGENGRLIELGVDALAEALKRAALNRDELRAMAAAARPSVEPFAWTAIAPRLIAIIEERIRR